MQAHWHSPTSTISPPQSSQDRKRGSIVIGILEAQLLASACGDAALDAARAELGVRVRDAREGSLGGRVLGAAEADVVDDGVSDHVAVGRVDGLGAAVLEDGRLDQELGAHAGVDAGVDGREVAAVRGEVCVVSRLAARRYSRGGESFQTSFVRDLLEDVARAEAEGRSTRVDVAPVVVCVGDVQVTGVFGAVGVGVANQGGLVLCRRSPCEYIVSPLRLLGKRGISLSLSKQILILTWS